MDSIGENHRGQSSVMNSDSSKSFCCLRQYLGGQSLSYLQSHDRSASLFASISVSVSVGLVSETLSSSLSKQLSISVCSCSSGDEQSPSRRRILVGSTKEDAAGDLASRPQKVKVQTPPKTAANLAFNYLVFYLDQRQYRCTGCSWISK